jgi:ABC-2 type transport system permease protein
VHGTTIGYTSFFVAGVLSMASFGIGINTSYGFFVDRDNGIFYEFLTYPMTRAEFLVGKILFNGLLSFVQTLLTLLLAALLLNVHLRFELVGIALAVSVLGTAGWFFFLASFALRIRRNDMFNTFINVAYFILMFASSIFYPLDTMPGWLRVCAYLNPITWHTDVLRFATVGIGSFPTIVGEGAAFILFLLASFWVAVRTLRYGILR